MTDSINPFTGATQTPGAAPHASAEQPPAAPTAPTTPPAPAAQAPPAPPAAPAGVPAAQAPPAPEKTPSTPSADAHAERMSMLDKMKKTVGIQTAAQKEASAVEKLKLSEASLAAVTAERDALLQQNAQLDAGIKEISEGINQRVAEQSTTRAHEHLASFGQSAASLPPVETETPKKKKEETIEDLYQKAEAETDPLKRGELFNEITKREHAEASA